MSMGTIGRMMKGTRTHLLNVESDDAAREFTERFGLRDGDYIEFQRNTSHGPQLAKGRIVRVNSIYFNHRGGYTAHVEVVPVLSGGHLGRSKSVALTINANGTGLKGIRGPARRLPQAREPVEEFV